MPKPEQCQNCTKPATIHLTQIIDNVIHKVDLCEDCPHKGGVTQSEGFSLADFLLKPPAVLAAAKEALRCEHCGFTPADFKRSGRFGCPGCYTSFQGMLKPMLSNMHRDTTHKGKVPEYALARVNLRGHLEQLQASLNAAIRDEQYETAAQLRDEIRSLREKLAETPTGGEAS